VQKSVAWGLVAAIGMSLGPMLAGEEQGPSAGMARSGSGVGRVPRARDSGPQPQGPDAARLAIIQVVDPQRIREPPHPVSEAIATTRSRNHRACAI
jgi:hypothetical protein